MTLLLIEFNNYFNRIVKKYDSHEDYISESTNYHFIKEQYNFNPNDGINANAIINWTLKWNPDYLLCLNDNNEIVSRWYIMESVRTRGGQYSITLRRDVLSDKLDTVLNSPCFIQKGFVSSDNPLIYNKEDFACNQIKVGENIIPDKSRCSWLVLYYNLSKKNDLTGSVTTIEEPYIEIGTTKSNWSIFRNYGTSGYKIPTSRVLKINANWQTSGTGYGTERYRLSQKFDDNLDLIGNEKERIFSSSSPSLKAASLYEGTIFTNMNYAIQANKVSIKYRLDDYNNPLDTFQTFYKWQNKIIKTTDNEYYRVHITPVSNSEDNIALTSGNLFDEIKKCFYRDGQFVVEGFFGSFEDCFEVKVYSTTYKLELEPITNGISTYNFNFSGCNDINDQPYGIIAMPYKAIDNRIIQIDSRDTVDNISVMVARELCKAGVGQDKPIYDAQILPYCPLELSSVAFTNSVSLNVGTDLDESEYIYIYNAGGTQVGIALFPHKAKFTKNIDAFDVLLKDRMNYVEDKKIENQLKFFRLVSPNYSGQFEFSRAKNNGINYFNVDCTYKPYAPYIHVNPDFNGLYGRDFNDARGLICGGDFSFSVISNAFETYKLQNKNFNEIFNRQIENMEVQHDISLQKNIAGIGLSTAKGLVGGAIAGGNPLSMAVGATGGLASGITNIAFGEKTFKEQREMAIDMHNFQLDNIQAIPDSLTKVDSYNNNNKIFPFLEMYSCTEEEKEIFRSKLKYEGMTVNAIGKLEDYLSPFESLTFVKGQILRLEGLREDNHFANEIYTEVAKGVYIER